MSSYDLLCVGNAITDLVAEVDSHFLERLNIVSGSMRLVSAEQMLEMQKQVQIKQISGGGSAANSAVIAARMGVKVAYLGKLADDKEGRDFTTSMIDEGIFFPTSPLSLKESIPTARCLVVVTPDKQRTMFTYLGACVEFSLKDISPQLIKDSKIIYLEGYLFDKPEAKDAFWHSASLAKKAGNKVALTLSDVFCVQRHKQEFREFIKENIDILFANEAEFYALYDVKTEQEILEYLKEDVSLSVVTCGEKGAIILEDGQRHDVPAQKVFVRDTTGAGDAFAAGFLAAYLKGQGGRSAACYGHRAASHVIGHFGGRPDKNFFFKIE